MMKHGRGRGTRELHVVVSDLHFPFIDKTAEQLVLALVSRAKPDCIHVLGDLLDCYRFSRFQQDPNKRKAGFQSELDQANRFLRACRKYAPKARMIISEGNHEDRLRKYKWTQAQGFADLRVLQWPALLRIDDLGAEWKAYTEPYKIGQLMYHHGKYLRKWSGQSAMVSAIQAGCSLIMGHTHRMGHVVHSTWTSTVQGWENGCLCRLDPEYVHGPPDWQQGFSLVQYGKGREFGVIQVPIKKGRYWLEGEGFSL